MKKLRIGILVAGALIAVTASADVWRFVVAGDGRSNPGAKPPRPEDKDGINTKVTAEMRDAVLREKVDLLLWTGDLVYGSKDTAEFRKMMSAWLTIMKPLYDHGVEVLPVRGNHEMTCPESVTVWNEIFSGPRQLPQNGPWNAKNLSYYAIRHGVLFVGIDQYASGKETVPLGWLGGVLRTKKFNHTFAFGHEMAFMAGNHKDCLDRDPAMRDAFWRLLEKVGSRAFFAGHDHFYDHMAVSAPGPNPPPAIHQYVAGTAGAPFYKPAEYTGANGDWKLSRVKSLNETYGYLLVEIDGPRCTITFKGRNAKGKYVPMDVWSYVAGAAEPAR